MGFFQHLPWQFFGNRGKVAHPAINLVRRPPSRALRNGAFPDSYLESQVLYPSETLRTLTYLNGEDPHEELLSWQDGRAYLMKEISLDVPSGIVFVAGTALEESNSRSGSIADYAAVSKVNFVGGRARSRHLRSLLESDTPKFFINDKNRNYHQWLEFSVPRMLAAKRLWPDVQFLSASGHPGFLVEYFRGCGIVPTPLPAGTYRVKNLVVAEGRIPFLPHRLQITDLVEFFNAENSQQHRPGKAARVFISRARERNRASKYEPIISKELERQGWQILTSRELGDVPRSLAVIKSASHVCGFHGAGLSNIIFCEPGANLTELSSRGFWKPSYARLSKYLDVGYRHRFVDSMEEAFQVLDLLFSPATTPER